MEEKKRLYDGPVNITGRKVTADRTVDGETVTYTPHGSSGSKLGVSELVYELMLIAGRDMLQAGKTVYGGDFTASELAGKVSYLKMFTDGSPEWEDYKLVRIRTKNFDCQFNAGQAFEQIAEWEGVMGLQPKNCHRFHADGAAMPKGTALKPYRRCHGYTPKRISYADDERRINGKLETLGALYRSLTPEGMRKALSVVAAARYFENKSHEWQHMAKEAMRWKLWKDYAREPGSRPIPFSAQDFKPGPACYQGVDTKYATELFNHVQRMIADSPMPEWPAKGDTVMLKGRDKMQKKYGGKFLCEGLVASLSTYGDRIEWRASVRVKKYDNEYFLPGQLEPVPDSKPKAASKPTPKAASKPKAIPEKKTEPSLAERLRQALQARLAA